jgi:DNA-binding transcriptional MerR regulator
MELAQSTDKKFSIEELQDLTQVPRRTIRYYIELGLVERPIGETRAAYYTWRHLQQLLAIREMTEAGLTLDAVRRRLAAAEREGKEPGAAPAASVVTLPSIEVRSHLRLAPGVELVIEPGAAQLSPEQLRRLLREALEALARVREQSEKE